jgi:hypothetical protein
VKFDFEVLCHWCHCEFHGADPKRNKRRRKRATPRIVAMTMDEYLRLEAFLPHAEAPYIAAFNLLAGVVFEATVFQFLFVEAVFSPETTATMML